MIEASRGNRVFGWRVREHPPAAPRGVRELIAVIAVTPETEEVPKLLKTWSGRWDSNPRRPAWEAGILPLNYSRAPLFSATSLSPKDLTGFPAIPYRLCNPSRTMGSDRKMDSKTDSKPTPAQLWYKQLCAGPIRHHPLHDTINISHHNGGAMRRRIVRLCQWTGLEPLAPSWVTRWASYRGSGDSRDDREWQI